MRTVFLRSGTDDADHRRVQIFDQGAGGILVLPAHSWQAICDVQIQVVADDDTRGGHGVTGDLLESLAGRKDGPKEPK